MSLSKISMNLVWQIEAIEKSSGAGRTIFGHGRHDDQVEAQYK